MTLREALDLLELNERTLEQSMLETSLQNRLEHTDLRHVLRVFEAYRKVNAFLNPSFNTQGDARMTIVDESMPGAPAPEVALAAALGGSASRSAQQGQPSPDTRWDTQMNATNPRDTFSDTLIVNDQAFEVAPEARLKTSGQTARGINALALVSLLGGAFAIGVFGVGPLLGALVRPAPEAVVSRPLEPVAPVIGASAPQANNVQPNTVQPNAAQPSAVQPSTVQPNPPQVSTPQPQTTPPQAVAPSETSKSPAPGQSSSPNPFSSAPQASAPQPNSAERSPVQPSPAQPSPVQPNPVRPTPAQPSSAAGVGTVVKPPPRSVTPAPSRPANTAPSTASAANSNPRTSNRPAAVARPQPRPSRPPSSAPAAAQPRVRASAPRATTRVTPAPSVSSRRVANERQFTQWDRTGAVLRYRSWRFVPDAVRRLSPSAFRAAVFVASSPATLPDIPR